MEKQINPPIMQGQHYKSTVPKPVAPMAKKAPIKRKVCDPPPPHPLMPAQPNANASTRKLPDIVQSSPSNSPTTSSSSSVTISPEISSLASDGYINNLAQQVIF